MNVEEDTSVRFSSSYTIMNSRFLSYRILNTFTYHPQTPKPFFSLFLLQSETTLDNRFACSFSSLSAFSADRSVELLIFVFPPRQFQPLSAGHLRSRFFLSSRRTRAREKKMSSGSFLHLTLRASYGKSPESDSDRVFPVGETTFANMRREFESPLSRAAQRSA